MPKPPFRDHPDGGTFSTPFRIGQPTGHGAYEVQSIEATQTNTSSAGPRKISSKLKIVGPNTGNASASIKASGINAKPFKGEYKKILYEGEINVGKVQISGKLDFRLTEELTWTVASWGPKVCTEGFSEPVSKATLYDFDK